MNIEQSEADTLTSNLLMGLHICLSNHRFLVSETYFLLMNKLPLRCEAVLQYIFGLEKENRKSRTSTSSSPFSLKNQNLEKRTAAEANGDNQNLILASLDFHLNT